MIFFFVGMKAFGSCQLAPSNKQGNINLPGSKFDVDQSSSTVDVEGTTCLVTR